MLSTHSGADGTLTPVPDRSDAEYLPAAPPGYELIRSLGEGGMGSVYLSHEVAPDRTVAIKLLHAPGSPTAYDRFLVEVRALAQLDHPNVVRVFAVETNWREPYFTMEYAAGGTLADLISPDRPLPDPADAARLILDAARGVAAAHAAGIWHRDLKPSNILLVGDRRHETADGKQETGVRGQETGRQASPGSGSLSPVSCLLTPKVSDFGLAKRTDRDDGLTRTGPIGTPGYMSPEAADGRYRDVGPASDVYGLAATLYHLLTGRPPFFGRDPADVIRRVVTDVPDRPRAIRPEVPVELEAVVVRAMEKDPGRRYATVEGFADDLRRALTGLTPAAPLLTRRRRAWRWLVRNRARVAAVAVVLLALAVAVWISIPPPEPADAIRKGLASGRREPLLRADGQPRWSAWPLVPAELEASPENGGTCTFHSRETCVLLLLDDPGTDHYRVRAEIRHNLKAGVVAPRGANHPDTDAVGLVVGYGGQAGGNGTRVHSMLVLGFSEYDRPPGPKDRPRKLTLTDLAVFGAPLEGAGHFEIRGLNARIDPPADGAPPWRPAAIDVTPAGLLPSGKAAMGLHPAAEIAQRRAALAGQVANSKAALAAPLPGWSPRMPLGIWSNGSSVSVRNVTIEPIP
jgi:serine/threonine protein kinase